jgi:hypothetical protein
MSLDSGRLGREYRTMRCMVGIYCADHHGSRDGATCVGCAEFLDYAGQRLAKCPYGDDKPVCANCPIHCYKRVQREQAQAIMRYAGPRMTLRHPWLSIMHMLDKLRRAEHPMVVRNRKRERSGGL